MDPRCRCVVSQDVLIGDECLVQNVWYSVWCGLMTCLLDVVVLLCLVGCSGPLASCWKVPWVGRALVDDSQFHYSLRILSANQSNSIQWSVSVGRVGFFHFFLLCSLC